MSNGLGVAIVDRDGKSSLLSLVKAFDSVLAVYEGFCNLKQVCFFFNFFFLTFSVLVGGKMEEFDREKKKNLLFYCFLLNLQCEVH